MKKTTSMMLVIFYLLIAFAYSLSFTASPSINDGSNAFTTEVLSCAWTSSGDTVQTNISWYRDGSLILNQTGVTSPGTLGSGNTTKGEVWNCTITIANATAVLSASDTIDILNSNPSALQVVNETSQNIGNTTTILEDIARTFNVTTTDADGDAIEFSAIGLPTGSTFNTQTGTFQWTPTDSQEGQNNVTFIALDNNTPDRGSAAKDINFVVQEVNDAPIFNPALVNQTATEGVLFSYAVTVTDEESDFPINFTLNTNLSSLTIINTSNTTATINFTPTFADRGNYTVNVIANDTRNGSATGTFNLEVIPVNQLPNLTIPSTITGTQGESFAVIVNATDADVNDTLTFSISSVSCAVSNPWVINKLGQTLQGNLTFANATINDTLTNNQIICNQVNIQVSDGKESASQIVTFNLTNVNDAPTINQNSTNALNTGGANISQQTAFTFANFIYFVNATDPDSLVSGGENLSYSDNSTFFDIGATTGIINFTPNASLIGNHSLLITVTDDEGLADNETISLEIRNNSAPVITNPGNLSCAEDVLCTIFIDATDADGDNMTFSSNSTAIFNITTFNTTAGIVNTTHLQSNIGNYTITVTATDARGASGQINVTFSINSTNDAPVLGSITFPSLMVATHPVSIQVSATDEDIDLIGGAELLNFSNVFITSQSLFNITTSFSNITNQSTGIIQFTADATETGTHTVNITVTDPQGASDSQLANLTILNDTLPPNISQIRPYGLPFTNFTVLSLGNISDFPGSNTTVNITENITVLFNHTTTDDTTALADFNITWEYDGTLVSTSYAYSRSFNFFSSGSHNLTLTVRDDKLENTTFIWFLNVTNLNRPPLLINSLENVSISSTETFTNYLLLRVNQKFIDPDDDLNSDNDLDSNETNSLGFSASECSVADITIAAGSVTFTPQEVGTCSVVFTATDATDASSLNSNSVLVNVTAVPEGTTESVTTTSTSGGGGGGGGGITRSSSSIIIPRDKEVDKPKPLNLIAPDEITLYKNRSITIPIYLDNTWNKTLTGIDISAKSNYSDVQISFDRTHFDELLSAERRRVDMTVNGYRLGDNFEISVNATVEDPEFLDTAVILFNSIEQSETGEQVEVKVTFAKDLLASNKECQELGELITKAQSEATQNNYGEALRILDTVINGCKYLVSKTDVNVEQPASFNLGFIKRFRWFYLGAGTLLFLFIGAIVMIEIRIKQESKHKEGED